MTAEACRDFAASEDPTDEHCQTCGHEGWDHRPRLSEWAKARLRSDNPPRLRLNPDDLYPVEEPPA